MRARDASREAAERARDRARLQREQYRLYGGDVAGSDGLRGVRSILKNTGDGMTTRGTTAASTASDLARRPITANVKGPVYFH